MACKICEARRPRRFCPGVGGDICSLCCGSEREVTVDCPLDCRYLRDARRHEKQPPADPDQFPNPDVRVTEQFLREHEELLLFTARKLSETALAKPGTVDYDVRETLDSLVRTFRTLESGLYYETRPSNPVAAGIQQQITESLEEFRRQLSARAGMSVVRDADVLGVLVFLQRLEISHNNGRKRGRAFLDFLRSYFPASEDGGRSSIGGSPLVVP